MERTEGGRVQHACVYVIADGLLVFFFGCAPGGSAASICRLFPFCSEVEQSGKRGVRFCPSVGPSITGLWWCWASA